MDKISGPATKVNLFGTGRGPTNKVTENKSHEITGEAGKPTGIAAADRTRETVVSAMEGGTGTDRFCYKEGKKGHKTRVGGVVGTWETARSSLADK